MSENSVDYDTEDDFTMYDPIYVGFSDNGDDFVIWDQCNRYIPINLDNLRLLIDKLTGLESVMNGLTKIPTIDPVSFFKN